MPFYGDEIPWQSEFDSGNFLSDALNGDMMGTETFIVRPSREPFESSVLLAADSGTIFAPLTPFEFTQEEPRNWDSWFPPTLPKPKPKTPLENWNDRLYPNPNQWRNLPERWEPEEKESPLEFEGEFRNDKSEERYELDLKLKYKIEIDRWWFPNWLTPNT